MSRKKYLNWQDIFTGMVKENALKCTTEILEAKKQYVFQMLEDAFTAPKTYWIIINHSLYNKRIPAIPPL